MESGMCPAAQVIMSIVPTVGIVFVAVLIFFALLWKHRENKLRILDGTYEPIKFNFKVFSLFTGLCLIGVGAVLTVMFALLDGLSWTLIGGLIPLVLGIMLLIFYKINPEYKNK